MKLNRNDTITFAFSEVSLSGPALISMLERLKQVLIPIEGLFRAYNDTDNMKG